MMNGNWATKTDIGEKCLVGKLAQYKVMHTWCAVSMQYYVSIPCRYFVFLSNMLNRIYLTGIMVDTYHEYQSTNISQYFAYHKDTNWIYYIPYYIPAMCLGKGDKSYLKHLPKQGLHGE